jgi:hypothetical protein
VKKDLFCHSKAKKEQVNQTVSEEGLRVAASEEGSTNIAA